MDYVGAIIGVIGTLLGTVLGFYLNYLANKGKVKLVFFEDWRSGDFSGIFFDIEIINTKNYCVIFRDFAVKTENGYIKLNARQSETACVSYGDKNNPFKAVIIRDFVSYDVATIKCEAKSRTMARLHIIPDTFTNETFKKLTAQNKITIVYTDNTRKKCKSKIKRQVDKQIINKNTENDNIKNE